MTRLLVVVVAMLSSILAFAQAPVAPAPPPAAASQADNLPSPPADFTYNAEGRRDPFATLTRRDKSTVIDVPGGVRPAGAAGVAVDEMSVRGIVFTNGTFVAMIAGAAPGQSYSVRAGSKLLDGTVRAIDARSVLIVQQVSDPLSLEKQREVRKFLRTQEEGK